MTVRTPRQIAREALRPYSRHDGWPGMAADQVIGKLRAKGFEIVRVADRRERDERIVRSAVQRYVDQVGVFLGPVPEGAITSVIAEADGLIECPVCVGGRYPNSVVLDDDCKVIDAHPNPECRCVNGYVPAAASEATSD